MCASDETKSAKETFRCIYFVLKPGASEAGEENGSRGSNAGAAQQEQMDGAKRSAEKRIFRT